MRGGGVWAHAEPGRSDPGGSGLGGYRYSTTCLPVVEPGKPFADAVGADTELKNSRT